MKKAAWEQEWLTDAVTHLEEPIVWRGVETQYASSSLQLVDSHAEHDVLEALLEASKPPLSAETLKKHFLLFTPFRYTPGQGSRFLNALKSFLQLGGTSICSQKASMEVE